MSICDPCDLISYRGQGQRSYLTSLLKQNVETFLVLTFCFRSVQYLSTLAVKLSVSHLLPPVTATENPDHLYVCTSY